MFQFMLKITLKLAIRTASFYQHGCIHSNNTLFLARFLNLQVIVVGFFVVISLCVHSSVSSTSTQSLKSCCHALLILRHVVLQ